MESADAETTKLDPQDTVLKIFQQRADELAQSLLEQNLAGAFSAIDHMHAAREESIYHALGMLARGLNTALVNFQVDDHGKTYLVHDTSGAAPVTSQLENVVRMSEESARKTLNVLEESLPLVQRMRKMAETCGDDSQQARELLTSQGDGLATLESNLMDILMAQTYQDLAGQAIRKVNGILETLQIDLVALLTFAKRVRSISEPVPPRRPVLVDATPADDADNAIKSGSDSLSQDAVNDLLSSLGF